MASLTKQALTRLGLYRLDRRLKQRLRLVKYEMSYPPYGPETHRLILSAIDVVRYGAVALALTRLRQAHIAGDIAEVGVYRGELSKFMATVLPERTLHLFDTFHGFPAQDFESAGEADDHRFQDTSVAAVRRLIGDGSTRVIFHEGYFPETARELTAETFALVVVDVDKYKPTRAALEVFYPRMNAGGYFFVHDYNSPESDYGVSRAVDEFLRDKPEQLVELPDRGGSVVIRKTPR